METARVDIMYRPLRIGFPLLSGDRDAFRKALRINGALWGGRYNPLVPVDRSESGQIVDVFRPDILVPVGDDPSLAEFVARYPHLRSPFHHGLFVPPSHGRSGEAGVLDLQNLIVNRRNSDEWKHFVEAGVLRVTWEEEDPLADVFSASFGGVYPEPPDIGINYLDIVRQATNCRDTHIANGAPVAPEISDHPNLSHLGRFGLRPHYSTRSAWIYPGFYVGRASDTANLIDYWNLRACGIGLMFLDLGALSRTSAVKELHLERLRADQAGKDSFRNRIAVWSRDGLQKEASDAVADKDLLHATLGEGIWNGMNLVPQQMHFGVETTLGIMSGDETKPQVRFGMRDKPFAGDVWFHRQHLVASISMIGARSRDAVYTFTPPAIPELNLSAGREMYLDYRGVRLGSGNLGVITDAAEHDITLYALPAATLVDQIFGLGGYRAKTSSSGLIARQLITRMGGVDGARAFKIPGVRRLIKTHGPNDPFGKKGALQLIGSTDPDTGAQFAAHKDLYIEPRSKGDLDPKQVFGHLVEKGLFRIGVELTCPACSLSSWTALDELRQQAKCTLCGNDFDATRQLVQGEYAYRRNGVMGLEKNTQGAIPVVLLLQQLSVNIAELGSSTLLEVSQDLTPLVPESDLPACEVDFFILTSSPHSSKTTVLIGECKDGSAIDANDIENLRKVADALPSTRLNVYILLAKLSGFTKDEISLARSLNSNSWGNRVIMLTARELEPYHIYERTEEETGLKLQGHSAEDLAQATKDIYFSEEAVGRF